MNRSAGYSVREDDRELDHEHVAAFAATVYHEARHAEQFFRASRLRAARHQRNPLVEVNPDIVHAAERVPLAAKAASARERAEADTWDYEFLGQGFAYAMEVEAWLQDISDVWQPVFDIVRAGADVKDARIAPARAAVEAFVAATKSGRLATIRSTLAGARAHGLAARVSLPADRTRAERRQDRARRPRLLSRRRPISTRSKARCARCSRSLRWPTSPCRPRPTRTRATSVSRRVHAMADV